MSVMLGACGSFIVKSVSWGLSILRTRKEARITRRPKKPAEIRPQREIIALGLTVETRKPNPQTANTERATNQTEKTVKVTIYCK